MTTATFHNPILGIDSWGLAEETDRRFRRITSRVLPAAAALAIVMPLLHFEVEKPLEKPAEPLVITVLPEVQPPPPPQPETKAEEPAPEKPKPQPQATPKPAPPKEKPSVEEPTPAAQARQLAEQSGLMKFRDKLTSLRSNDIASVTSQQPLVNTPSTGYSDNGQVSEHIASAASGSSGGIGNGRGITDGQRGTDLGARRTAGVQSSISYGNGNGRSAATGSGDGNGTLPTRTKKEIQEIFDNNKSSLFSIFNRAARENPGMGAGKIVLNLTIAPDGSVLRCEIVSSSFGESGLEDKIVQRIKLMNFGAKKVPEFVYANYPIQFVPS